MPPGPPHYLPRVRHPWALVLALETLGAPSLMAQELSVLLGGAHARYADSLTGTAGVAAVRLRILRPFRALNASVAFSQFTSGEWAVQTAAQGAAFFPLSPRFAWGIAGGATLSDFEGGTLSGTIAGGPVLVASNHRVFLSLGASGGAVRSVDDVTRALGTGTLRMHYQATPHAVLDVGIVGVTAEDGITYGDLTGGVTWQRGTILVGGTVGVRTGDLDDDPWVQGRVEWTAAGFARIEAAAGRYPRDLTGFTDGVFVQAGVRLVAGARPQAPVRVGEAPRPVRATLLSGSTVRVSVTYTEPVQELAIAGDFSGWEPVPMRRVGPGVWTVELDLGIGVHRYSLIADGTWTLPRGVAEVDDEFGGKVGVLVVGGGR